MTPPSNLSGLCHCSDRACALYSEFIRNYENSYGKGGPRPVSKPGLKGLEAYLLEDLLSERWADM